MMKGEDLYEKVKQLIGNWLQENVQQRVISSILPILLRAQATQHSAEAQDQFNERREAGEKFLGVLKEAWEDHQLCMGMIKDVLMYMVSYLAPGLVSPNFSDCTSGSNYSCRSFETLDLRRRHGLIQGPCRSSLRASR